MISKFLAALGCLILLGLGLRAQAQAPAPPTRLVEKVTASPSQVIIPYEKYVLPNGLTLLVSEDHSDPLVRVELTFHVGSAREQPGHSGFAHLFEHLLLFQGSAHEAAGRTQPILAAAGGNDINGTTSRDKTSYYETLPVNQLETGLRIGAEQLGFSLGAATAQGFAREQDNVKNERLENEDNAPYGRADEVLRAALYPAGHPYSWLTGGTLADINGFTRAEADNFFLRWYGPNNAVLAIVGDVQPAEVVRLVEKYFGPIPTGPAVPRAAAAPAHLAQTRYVSYEDTHIKQPLLVLAYAAVPQLHPDELALDALAELLGNAPGSVFYRTFLEKQQAAEASASNNSNELAGEFELEVKAQPGASLRTTEAQVRAALAEFARRGVTDEELARFKAKREMQELLDVAGVAGKAVTLVTYDYLSGNPNQLPGVIARLRALTPADVMRVFRQYVQQQPAVVLSVVPLGSASRRAAPDNFRAPAPLAVAPLPAPAPRQTPETFDRRPAPTPGPAPAVPTPVLWRTTLANGVRVLGTQNTELPVTQLQLTIAGGDRLLPAPARQAGLAALTAAMLSEGTARYSSVEMAAALARLGSRVTFEGGRNETTVTVQTLTRHLDATLALVLESLLHPRFAPADFARAKQQQLTRVRDEAADPGGLAYNVLQRQLYGPARIDGWPVEGTAATVSSLTLADVQHFYRTYYAPNLAALAIVSDAPQAAIVPQLAGLLAWTTPAVAPPRAAPTPAAGPGRLYFVEAPGAPQSSLRLGYAAMPYDATGPFYHAHLMQYPLGWARGSRLYRNLRDQHGYTYSVWARFSATPYDGNFTAATAVRADATAPALRELLQEITTYRASGITPDELATTKTTLSQKQALLFEIGLQKVAFLTQLLTYDLPADYLRQQAAVLAALTKPEVDALAKQYLPVEQFGIVVVGDKRHLPALRQLGYPVVMLDASGQPLPPPKPRPTKAIRTGASKKPVAKGR